MTIAESRGFAAEHRTVTRVMAIIELVVGSDGGLRLGDIATAMEAPKSSVHGLAKGLVAAGYLREEDGRYITGPAIASLLAVGPSSLPAAYHHTLTELTNRWKETTMLASLVGDSLVYLDVVQSDSLIRASPPGHVRQLLWPRSSGKVFLAFMKPRAIDTHLRRLALSTSEVEAVLAELEQIRQTSQSVNRDGELLGLASPVIFPNRPVTLAIAIAGPSDRMLDNADEISMDVRLAAEMLSAGG